MSNLIIRTRFPNSLNRNIRVLTLMYNKKWITFAPDLSSREADSLLMAGQHHLDMALIVKEKLSTTGICGTFSHEVSSKDA